MLKIIRVCRIVRGAELEELLYFLYPYIGQLINRILFPNQYCVQLPNAFTMISMNSAYRSYW